MRILVIGQTPPPYHGQAIAIEALVHATWKDLSIEHLRMDFSDVEADVGRFQPVKLFRLFRLLWRTWRQLLRHRDTVLYYPPASPRLVPFLRDILFLPLVRPLAAKTVFHFHACGIGDFVRRRPWLKPMAFLAYGRADVAVQLGDLSPPDGAYFRARRVALVPNGLDVPIGKHAGHKRTHSSFRILFVGSLAEEKGMRHILQITKLLDDGGIAFELRLAGAWRSATEQRMLQRLADTSGIADRLTFCGVLTGEEKWREYADADVFLFPSLIENMPLVVIEAMAFGLPVVASRLGNLPNLVVDGVTGYLCGVDDVSLFADILTELSEKQAHRENLGRAGRKRYERHFRLDAHLDAMRSLFLSLTSHNHSETRE